MSQAKHNLEDILRNLDPKLVDGCFIFMSSNEDYNELFCKFNPIATFKEKEGMTLVISEEDAEKFSVSYDSKFRCLSLGVHSSLESYGLISTISEALTKERISCNVFAGFFHDHIFVQEDKANRALEVIKFLSHS